MQGKEAIINRILSDAKAEAKANLDDAQKKADKLFSSANEQCEKMRNDFEKDKKRIHDEILFRSSVVAELDAQKYVLQAKNLLISQTFEKVLDKLKKLDSKVYDKLISKMLEFASDGDVVTVSSNDKKSLTKEKLADFAAQKKVKLSLSKDNGDFVGGIVLSSGGVDKNITFETEISQLKEEYEEVVAKMLFSEDK